MDEKQTSLGSLLLVGSGTILTVSGSGGGRFLVAAGGLALAGTALQSVRRLVGRPA